MQKLMLVIWKLLSAPTKCEIKYRDKQTGQAEQISQAEPFLWTRGIIACRTIDGGDLACPD